MSERVDCKCGTTFCKHNKAQVWSNGGGTQSWAIAAAIIKGMIEKPTLGVTADTDYETGATWDGMKNVISPALKNVGVDLEVVSAKEWNTKRATLFIKYVDDTRRLDVMVPAFSSETGMVSKLSNFCTGRWKVEPIDAYLRIKHGLKRDMIVKWIGFSRDEQRRIISMQQGEEFQKGLIRFPLLELGLTRQDCIKLVESMGWGTPPRSACYMCPNHSDHEWRKLKAERPDEFQKAVELEREIHKVDPDAWLHRSCMPLDQVDFSQPEDLFSRPCDSGMCFV